MSLVCIDARDGWAPELRGWGRHVRLLVEALLAGRSPASPEYLVLKQGGRGPEILFEQAVLPRVLRSRGADLVHSPNCFLPLHRPCPGVVTIHDLAFETHPGDFARTTGLKFRHITRRAAISAERVICVSRFTATDVAERYGIDPAKIRVVPNAPALPLGALEPPPGPYLLAVGDLRAKKNFGRLIAAFRLLHAGGIEHRLVIAGTDAGEGAALAQAARGLPVELPGYVDDARLDALMRGADALVHPSLYEGFGLVLVEAMARGVPVAAAYATALPEVVGNAGLLFDPLDHEAIAAALRRLLEDPARRAELAERGRARAAEFSWERTAAQTEAVYGELLA